MVQPHNNLLCKSGTDFKNVTAITVTMPEAAAAAAAADGVVTNGVDGHGPGNGAAAPPAAAAAERPACSWQEYPMTSDVPEDPEMAQVGAGA